MLATEASERRRRRTEDGEAGRGRRRFEPPDDLGGGAHRILEGLPAHDGVDQRHHRRVAHAATVVQLTFEERRVILTTGELNAVVLGIQRLHNRLPGPLSAAGPPSHLREELERALGGTEIRETESHIRRDHADQRHQREIVSLGNHLRADQDVQLASREPG